MKAAFYDKVGPATEVLQVADLPDPEPGPGEVRVRVHFSGVNPSDVKSRAGVRGPAAFPRVIPHSDGSGEIESVGAGVDPRRIGQRVWVWNAAWQRPFGSCAEFVVLPEAQVVELPDHTSLEAGACLGIPAMTAHRCLFADGPIEGQTVLGTGGAGSVGAYAVQMARLGGAARVVATVSNEAKAAHALAMGADAVVHYRQADVVERLKEVSGGGFDRIVEVEFGGNLPVTRQVLKPNGIVAAYGSMAVPEPVLPFYPMMFAGQTLRTVLLYILPTAARQHGIDDITRWLEADQLQHPVAAVHPLADAARAHEQVERGDRIGAVLVQMP